MKNKVLVGSLALWFFTGLPVLIMSIRFIIATSIRYDLSLGDIILMFSPKFESLFSAASWLFLWAVMLYPIPAIYYLLRYSRNKTKT